MDKIGANDARATSADVITENIRKLKTLFPELVTEGPAGVAVNEDVLKQLVGDRTVTDSQEKYGLNWYGKRAARRLALIPSTGTLRPCPDESVDWDTTQNLMIEGDNLEVLKLLQKSYAGKVKLIYIDPPYNTGKDFVYPDDYRDSIQNYMELTGQVDSGTKLSSNTEASGRFHTDWLNMMYPRLKLARNLMADDGLIMMSINDQEVHHLRTMCDEVFGADNFVECYVWNSTFRPDNSSRVYRKNAEFIICYARNIEKIDQLVGETIERTGLPSLTKASMSRSTLTFPPASVDFTLVDGVYLRGVKSSYELLDDVEVRGGTNVAAFRLTGHVIWGQENLAAELSKGTKIIIKTDGFVPYVDKGSEGTLRPPKILPNKTVGDVYAASTEIRQLFNEDVFSYPKPVSLLRYLIAFRTENDLVLDFFAGSGTTGHAVMAQNASDNGNRRYILVQLPEPLDPENKDQKTAADSCDKLGKPRNIAELTKERLRRAGKKIKEENPLFAGDLGFRVFKLASTNIREWDPNPSNVTDSLLDSVEHLKTDRTEDDILYELLLKRGLDLCVPMETRVIAGKTVHSIGAGTLIVCLAPGISRDEAEPLAQGIIAWHKELAPAGDTTCVFRDSGFVDDVAKTNLAAILQQAGLEHVESL